jgi:predicted nucleotidyltransferase
MADCREAELEQRGVAVSAMRSVLSASPLVDAAFVFGSLVRGGARHDSDLDDLRAFGGAAGMWIAASSAELE